MSALLLGYGTLLLKGSLGNSIGKASAQSKEVIPVVVRDHRRLFNVRPTHYQSSFKLSQRGIENAALNVEYAPSCSLNALGFAVNEEELKALDQRERYYVRQSAPMYTFESGEPLGTGEINVAPPDSPLVERDVAKLMPLWRDVVWARLGAYRISGRFGQYYDETTFLCDGQTRVIDVFREQLKDISDVEVPE
jgi:hypothetical protein